ncbi:MAG: DNA-binding protein [Rhodoferax sp.]|nr:DNA-binding protein [Rhodoferax sp.]
MHLTPRQLAARRHLSEKTLERWRHEGTGPAFLKVGGRVLYPLQHIEAIEADQTRTAQSHARA